jgi:hypothetical protein
MGNGSIASRIFTLGTKWPASLPSHTTSGVRAPGTQWIEDWVGPRTGLNAVLKRKIFYSTGNRNPLLKYLRYRSILPELLNILFFSNYSFKI